jgi:undecaprenyl-diphosphatase
MSDPGVPLELRGIERFAARSLLGLVGVVAGGAAFMLLLATVVGELALLRAVDSGVAVRLNDLVADRPLLVDVLRGLSRLGGAPANWLVIGVTVAWLLVRRLPRLATFAVVTGIGAAVLTSGAKALVGRLRPVVEVVVATAPGASFPSGHALGSTVAYGVVVLVFLPAMPARARPWLVSAVAVLLALVGFTRVALGVHYVSDVLAGWALGVAWLGVTATAFQSWRRVEGLPVVPASRGLAPEAASELAPAPAAREQEALPRPGRTAAAGAVGWVLHFGLLLGVGLLVTGPLAGAVADLDRAVLRWFVSVRDPAAHPVLSAASRLGSTGIVVAVAAVVTALSVAVTRRLRPALFLGVVMVGEVTLFLAVAHAVGRARPGVPHLGPGLPPTSSFPSGHVAAAVALYGAVALLAGAWARGRWRWVAWLAGAAGVLVPAAVAAARLYRGVHFPTDVLGSVLLAVPWLTASWLLLRPGPEPGAGGRGCPADRAGRDAG